MQASTLHLVLAVAWALTACAKECAPECVQRGNCNQDDGTCQCKYGWTGAICEISLFPGCQVGDWDLPQLGRAFPKNCECYKQAYRFYRCGPDRRETCQYNSYALHLPACYRYEGMEDMDQRSVLPEPGNGAQPPHTWHLFHGYDQPLRRLDPEDQFLYRDPWGPRHKVMPTSACPGSCSGHGSCIKKQRESHTTCLCHKGWLTSGQAGTAPCDAEDMTLCPNQCLGRGRCIMGFCHCQPPFWGHDCGRDAPVTVNPQAVPSRTKLAIYIYELPAWLSAPVPLDDGLHDRQAAHSANEHFLAALLKDTAVRVLDPYAANLFYVPAHTYSYSSNTGSPQNHLATVLKYVSHNWPFFNRTGGKDHVVWTPGDRGACFTKDIVRDVIKLTHFGYHVNREARVNVSYLDPAPEDTHQGCMNPLRDVVAPPYFEENYANVVALYEKVVAKRGVDKNRTLLFFFAGSVRPHQPSYSGGARQAVHKLLTHLNTTGADMHDILFITGRVPNYWELHAQSKFCLCPSGAGYGMRLVMAMQHACIPVITSDLVFQPLEDEVPYRDFAIRIPNSDLERLVDILRAVTDQEQAALRLGMAKWYRALMWQTDRMPLGEAYQYTLRALHRRRIHMWSNLYL